MPVVIGIDPGSIKTGWGIVSEKPGSLELVACGIIRTTAKNNSFSARLAQIFTNLDVILDSHHPDQAAIEQVFTAKNSMSALKLGQARGAAIAACASHGLDIFDYEPALVKKSLVGTGRADKEQVAFMVKKLLNVHDTDWPLDTSDALAVAICHLSQTRFMALEKRISISREKRNIA